MGVGSPDGKYRIRRYRDADRPSVLGLVAAVWGDGTRERTAALWDWKFERNPHNPPEGHGSLVIEHAGEPVGFLGFVSQRFHAPRGPVTLVWGTELCIDPRHRGRGYLVFQHIATEEPLTVAGNAGNPAIYDLQVKFGAYEVTRWINCKRILDGRSFLTARRVPGLLAAPAGAAIDLAGRLRGGRPAKGPACRILPGFDERFDAFWDEVRADHAFIGIRDREFLAWRFGACPARRYEVIGAEDGGRLRGYLVLRLEDTAKGRRGLIVDILARTGDDATLGALLQAAADHCRQAGANVLSCTVARNRRDLVDSLGRLGMRMTTPGIPVTAHAGQRPEHAALAETLKQSRDIYLTRADTDLDYNS